MKANGPSGRDGRECLHLENDFRSKIRDRIRKLSCCTPQFVWSDNDGCIRRASEPGLDCVIERWVINSIVVVFEVMFFDAIFHLRHVDMHRELMLDDAFMGARQAAGLQRIPDI